MKQQESFSEQVEGINKQLIAIGIELIKPLKMIAKRFNRVK